MARPLSPDACRIIESMHHLISATTVPTAAAAAAACLIRLSTTVARLPLPAARREKITFREGRLYVSKFSR